MPLVSFWRSPVTGYGSLGPAQSGTPRLNPTLLATEMARDVVCPHLSSHVLELWNRSVGSDEVLHRFKKASNYRLGCEAPRHEDMEEPCIVSRCAGVRFTPVPPALACVTSTWVVGGRLGNQLFGM
jgi:hypothetical protein